MPKATAIIVFFSILTTSNHASLRVSLFYSPVFIESGKNNVFHFPSSFRISSFVISGCFVNRYLANPRIAYEWAQPQAACPLENVIASAPQQYSQLIEFVI